MGYGDLIMAAGQAEDVFNLDPSLGPVAITASTGKIRWRDIWEGNPAIFCPLPGATPPARSVLSGRGYLPYLDNDRTTSEQWVWHPTWRTSEHRGSIYLRPGEISVHKYLPEPFILVEPTAERKHINRRPPARFWDDLVVKLRRHLPGYALAQLAHPDALHIDGLIPIHNEGFREACAILSRATALVATEGGLVHAAAALKVPAVVLWGGCISQPHLGYPEHANLVPADGEHAGCGRLTVCKECAEIWADLHPDAVLACISTYTPAGGAARDGIPRSRQ